MIPSRHDTDQTGGACTRGQSSVKPATSPSTYLNGFVRFFTIVGAIVEEREEGGCLAVPNRTLPSGRFERESRA